MKIHIKLLSGDIIVYIPRHVRGQRCKIETHKAQIEEMILKYLDLSKETHFVNIITEDDEKELDNVYYGGNVYIKSEYYEENTEENPIFAFVQSYDEKKRSYFESCLVLLNKASSMYYSLDENIRSITEDQAYEDPNCDIRIYHIKNGLETTIWQMSQDLGIPIILNTCDPHRNTVKKTSENPDRTILYYTRLIEDCEKKLKDMKN